MAVFIPATMMPAVSERHRRSHFYQRLLPPADYVSSGSEHEGSSVLSGNLHGFFSSDVDEDTTSKNTEEEHEEKENELEECQGSLVAVEMIRNLVTPTGDPFRSGLVRVVTDATERERNKFSNDYLGLRRAVMGSLRSFGYNAGVCKSRWNSSDGLIAGTHEYIDVVRDGKKPKRYIIEINFASEFEIWNPTDDYKEILQQLPTIFVGKAEELKMTVGLTAKASRRSLKARDMRVPPWRKSKYVLTKWLAPYKRTTNVVPTKVVCVGVGADIKWREVGFEVE